MTESIMLEERLEVIRRIAHKIALEQEGLDEDELDLESSLDLEGDSDNDPY